MIEELIARVFKTRNLNGVYASSASSATTGGFSRPQTLTVTYSKTADDSCLVLASFA